jgi:hypothetical protein
LAAVLSRGKSKEGRLSRLELSDCRRCVCVGLICCNDDECCYCRKVMLSIIVEDAQQRRPKATNTFCQSNLLGMAKVTNFFFVSFYRYSSFPIEKPVSTFVLGSSPEYELALYSMCFFSRAEKVRNLKNEVFFFFFCVSILTIAFFVVFVCVCRARF